MTPNQITMLIILIAYMAVVLAVGLYASRRVKGSEDFLLAGRSIGKPCPQLILLADVFRLFYK